MDEVKVYEEEIPSYHSVWMLSDFLTGGDGKLLSFRTQWALQKLECVCVCVCSENSCPGLWKRVRVWDWRKVFSIT